MPIINGILCLVMKLHEAVASNMWAFKTIWISSTEKKKYIPIMSFYEFHLWCLLLNDQCSTKHQSVQQKGAQTSQDPWLIDSLSGCRREWRKCHFPALLEGTDYSKHIFNIYSVPLGPGLAVFSEKSPLHVFIT